MTKSWSSWKLLTKIDLLFPLGLDRPKDDFENSRDFDKKSFKYLKKREYIIKQ